MKDLVAAAISGLCVLHCLATPLLVALGGSGFLLSFLGSEWFHYLLLLPISLLLVWSLPGGLCVHKIKTPFALGVTGFTLLLLSLFVHERAEMMLAVSGGILLASAHFYNRKLMLSAENSSHLNSTGAL